MTEIVRSQVATAPDTRIACVRSYESKAALMRELSVTVLIGRPETTHNSSCVRSGEPVPETGRYATNAAAWESIDGRNPSRGELVAEWVFERSLGEMFK